MSDIPRTIASEIYSAITVLSITVALPLLTHQLAQVITPAHLHEQHQNTRTQYNQADYDRYRLIKDEKRVTGQELAVVQQARHAVETDWRQASQLLQDLEYQITVYRISTACAIGMFSILLSILLPYFHMRSGMMLAGISTLWYGYAIYAMYTSNVYTSIYLTILIIISLCSIRLYQSSIST